MPFYEVINWAHVDQRIKLAQQISNWNAKRLRAGMPIFSKLQHDADKPTIFDPVFNQTAQNIAVDSIKKLSDVEFHHARARIN